MATVKQFNCYYTQLMDVTAMADRKRKIEGRFKVDLSVGRNLKLKVFNLEKADNIGSMDLTGPYGQSASQIEYDGTTASVVIPFAQVNFLNHLKSIN